MEIIYKQLRNNEIIDLNLERKKIYDDDIDKLSK